MSSSSLSNAVLVAGGGLLFCESVEGVVIGGLEGLALVFVIEVV
jgi:hypothetical protein